jgi:hypothetical protein
MSCPIFKDKGYIGKLLYVNGIEENTKLLGYIDPDSVMEITGYLIKPSRVIRS